MVFVSDHVLQAMGFEKAPDDLSVSAFFHGLHVFQIEGIFFKHEVPSICNVKIGDKVVEVGIGNSVNAICKSLLDDVFVDNEQEWQSEKRCRTPYAMVHIGPTQVHLETVRHIQRLSGDIHTYDSFSKAKSELAGLTKDVLPTVITALSSALTEDGRQIVRLNRIDSAVFGITETGQTLHDVRLFLSAKASSSSEISEEKLDNCLSRLEKITPKVSPKSANFFYLAQGEEDPLKKFLYFFLSVEIATHAAFGATDGGSKADLLLGGSASNWAKEISVIRDLPSLPNLRDRFLWCAQYVWTHLKEADVQQFKKLKKCRDDVAHGNIEGPSDSEVMAIESLATKLQAYDKY